MSAALVALVPKCVECQALWLPTDEERWRAYLLGDDPEAPAEGVGFCCPDCSEREFDG